MEHPETWHILPGESNWCEGDPYAIYLEGDGECHCVLFVEPILRSIDADGMDIPDGCEEDIFDVLLSIFMDVVSENIYCSAFSYFLMHELLHWGVSE